LWRLTSGAMEVNPKAVEANPKAVEANPKAVEANPKAVEANPKAVEANPKAAEANPKAVEALNEARVMLPIEIHITLMRSQIWIPHQSKKLRVVEANKWCNGG
jgi:hypothetical protein